MSTPVLDFDSIVLLKGGHSSRDEGVCALELVAWMAGEPHSDHPACVSPVLGDFCRNWNDNLDDATRQKMKPYLKRLIGTAGDEAADLRRSWMAFDWLARECGPEFMDLTPALHASAAALCALPEITDRASLDAAMPTIEAARKESAAAWDAARAAVWDAAWDAAGAAAWEAAWDAAWDAAGDAAGRTLQPVVDRLQGSAFQLLDRMITA